MDELHELEPLDLKSVLQRITAVNSARPRLQTGVSTSNLTVGLGEPSGNLYAANIKAIQDDSASVFPESLYSTTTTRKQKWLSTYEKDYFPRQEEEYERWLQDYMKTAANTKQKVKPESAPAFVGMRAMTSGGKMAAGSSIVRVKDDLRLTEADKVRKCVCINMTSQSLSNINNNKVIRRVA